MGIFVPCAFLLFTLLCIAIPGAAADPFEMPASFGFEHLADGEPPFTAAYGQMMDIAFDLSQSSSNGLSGLAGLSGTVRPTDTMFRPQLVEQHPDAFPTPPSSSGPSYYVPPQPRHDTYSRMDFESTTNMDTTFDAPPAPALVPRPEHHVPYTQAEYHADDRLAGGRTDGTSSAALEINSASRRRPHIVRGYPCGVCGNSFNRQRDLNLHARTHNPQQECPECDRRFVSRREVTRHVDSVHRRSRQFHCTICLNTFSRKDNLDRHVATVHRGRRRQVVVHQQPGR